MGATKWVPETTNKWSTKPTSKWMHQPREVQMEAATTKREKTKRSINGVTKDAAVGATRRCKRGYQTNRQQEQQLQKPNLNKF